LRRLLGKQLRLGFCEGEPDQADATGGQSQNHEDDPGKSKK